MSHAVELWKSLQKVRAAAPLVHNITNYVVMNNTANALLALGASPVMAHAPEEVEELVALYGQWRSSATQAERRQIWRRMLQINAEQLFAIGVVNGTLQPVVVSRDLKNVPQKGLYSFEPGAFFGRYMPDTFWFDTRKTVGLDKGRG